MNKVNVEIDSKVNEIFAKTIVTQKFKNESENPIELKIYFFKNDNLVFSSFSAKIGDSITVKSKVIKKEKAETKYTDSIASGNTAIYVMEDPENSQKLIINMGNIPANEEVIFISEYLQYVETSKSYEFEMFRNLPIFKGKSEIYQNQSLEGEKEIMMEELKINEENYLNEDKNNYLISYKICNLPSFSEYNRHNYIPSSKIYFELDLNQNLYEPLIYCQKSLLNNNELNYIINYSNKMKISNKDSMIIKPALFIFLIDQSGSMSGSEIKIASEGLKLFLQSLPPKSYYQIIGFGSSYKAYDEMPKAYIQQNISQSMTIINNLKADLGGTDIYTPLKYVYDSHEVHDKINLPRNIFLLTDGEIDNKKQTLDLIYKNSSKYSIYSIGIGRNYDKDLIKNAGIIGKGGYNFCEDLGQINTIIVNEINKSISSFYSNINIKTSLDSENMVNNSIPNLMRDNENINLNFIINNKENNNKINFEINYLENEEKIEKKYEIIPNYLEEGDELSKLIINNYLNNNNLDNENEVKMALKYQILRKNTSLFAEIELSNKAMGKMKEELIGNEENIEKGRRMVEAERKMLEEEGRKRMEEERRRMYEYRRRREEEEYRRRREEEEYIRRREEEEYRRRREEEEYRRRREEEEYRRRREEGGRNRSDAGLPRRNEIEILARRVINGEFGNSQERRFRLGPLFVPVQNRINEILGISKRYNMNNNSLNNNMGKSEKNNMKINNEMPIQNMNNSINCNNNKSISSKLNENPMNNIKEEEKIKTLDLQTKEDIMKIIRTQDFVNGFWEINEYTEIIKEKYKKEYNLLKSKNINDKVAITILIIYFINKEHPELFEEFLMIIRKAKLFIINETKDSYENIIKDI